MADVPWVRDFACVIRQRQITRDRYLSVGGALSCCQASYLRLASMPKEEASPLCQPQVNHSGYPLVFSEQVNIAIPSRPPVADTEGC